ncbi:unnamed protein product [Orchesella dallaii]|uniref:Uncharacterized protein n=1 Tax=Orchesella dallaii TaxID=48710 RepID=A0ABP1Q4P4_9HEXA
MRGFHQQLWVTAALSDEDVPTALTLSFSMREAMSNRKIGVIISPAVSPSFMALVDQCFDIVFPLHENWNKASLPTDQFAKLFTFTLKSFKKCVFLEPTMLIIKNADEIFEEYEDFTRVFFPNGDNSFVFMVKPSVSAFRDIMNALISEKENGASFQHLVKKLTSENDCKNNFFSEKYNHSLSSRNNEDIFIAHLPLDWGMEMDWNKLSVFEQIVFKKYKNIYQNNVLPMLAGCKENVS